MLSMMSGLKLRALSVWTAAQTSLRRRRGESDHRRWGDSDSLSPDWDSRSEQMARLISPGTSVLEFGAGRMALKKYLPEGCTYTPSDMVDRGDGTIVCDLNAPELPAFPHHDVAVFSGVLEYANDAESVISHVGQFVETIIASYDIREHAPERLRRRSRGWVNDFTSEEFEGLFTRAGFQRDRREDWGAQKIFRFVGEKPRS
jgi:hypothetical protein